MPGNTTPKVFRYPTLDMSPDVPRDLGYLATDIDNYLTNNPGPQGIQGPIGLTGAQGPQGPQGLQGEQGLTGLQGNTGAASTVPGPQGNPGVKGDTGLQGPQGDTGAQGIQGIQGLQGPQGPQGVKGDTGAALTVLGNYPTMTAFNAANLTGVAGSAWLILSTGTLMLWDTVTSSWFDAGALQGPQGPVGLTGAQGIQGIQGLKGDTGDQGAQGPVGPQGNTGLQGLQGIQGPQGLQGLQGIQGTQGVEGTKATFSITSATPPTSPVSGQAWFNSDNGRSYTYYDSYWVETGSSLSGPQGIQGIQGPQGLQGPQGVAINLKASSLTVAALPSTGNVINDARIVEADGDLYIWDGTSWTSAGQIVGPQGPQGIQGPKGDNGDQGIQGIQGPQGPQGDTGPQGIQGIQGLTGLTGNTGAQGAQGIQGIQGPQGEPGTAGDSATGYTKISTITSTSGTAVSFTGLSGYTKYLLVWSGVYTASAFSIPIIKLNNDSANHEFVYGVAYNSSSIPQIQNWSFKGTNAGSVGSVLGTPNAAGHVYIDGANTTSGISFYGSSVGKWSDTNNSGIGTFAGVYTGGSTVTSIVASTNDGQAYSNGTWVLWGAQR